MLWGYEYLIHETYIMLHIYALSAINFQTCLQFICTDAKLLNLDILEISGSTLHQCSLSFPDKSQWKPTRPGQDRSRSSVPLLQQMTWLLSNSDVWDFALFERIRKQFGEVLPDAWQQTDEKLERKRNSGFTVSEGTTLRLTGDVMQLLRTGLWVSH